MTKDELKIIFNQRYKRENWQSIIKDIFPNVSIFSKPFQIPISENLQTRITGFYQLGNIRLNDGKGIKIFELQVTKQVNLPRNRVEMRNLIAKYIDMMDNHGVLAIFNSSEDDYRFTFTSKDSEITETEGFVTKETDAKRYTYLLGPNEPCRTASDQLFDFSNIKNSAKIDDVIKAFSVEKLSKLFFNEYKEQYEKFVYYITGKRFVKKSGKWKEERKDEPSEFLESVFENDEKKARDFIKKTLGRIVFLHFLQKKGWMGCPENSVKWENGDKQFLSNYYYNCSGKDHFYSKYLVPLFFDCLNKKRENDLFEITNSRIPYLNGGLFENKTPKQDQIDFPIEFWEKLFEFFGQYNFTIDENDPFEQEVGIDPEMLGHIFENLLEDNKDKGAFYTPKPIVDYMCKESLIQYLKTHFFPEKSPLERGVPNTFGTGCVKSLEKDETSSEVSECVSALENFIRNHNPGDSDVKNNFIKNNARKIEQLLDNVKICDPAIGSGAFPMGILKEIFWAKMTLDWTLNPAEVKKQIIQNSIYGVDIDSGAIDIARLRFWLSLIVDAEEPEPLPNLDYKIMQGNSLLESFEGIELYEKDYKKEMEDLEKKVNELSPKENRLKTITGKFYAENKWLLPENRKSVKSLPDKKGHESLLFINVNAEPIGGISVPEELIKAENELKQIRKEINFHKKSIVQLHHKIPDKKVKDIISLLMKSYFSVTDPQNKKKMHKEIDKYVLEYIETKIDKSKLKLENEANAFEQGIKQKEKALQNEKQIAQLWKSRKAKELQKLKTEIENFSQKYEKIAELRETADRPFFLWHLYFADIFKEGGFDIVIANPPYIQLQKDYGLLASLYQDRNYITFDRTGDIYSLFYEQGCNILEDYGHICYITSNKWMRANYGKSLRKFFSNNLNPKILIDFGQAMIFEDAIVHSNILILQKNENYRKILAVQFKNEFYKKDISISSYITKHAIIDNIKTSEIWSISEKQEKKIKDKFDKFGLPLKKWEINFFRGILTGLNKAFIVRGGIRNELISKDQKNKEILKPILRGRDTRKYYCIFNDNWLINAHNGIKNKRIKRIDVPNNFPFIYEHLLKFKEQAIKRLDKGKHWTNLRNCAYIDEFEKPKIIFSEIVSDPQFYYDTSGFYPEATVFFITGDKLKFLTAMLNSKAVTYVFRKFYAGGELVGKYRYKKLFLEKLPIPEPKLIDELVIEKLVDQILIDKKAGKDTQILEDKIDLMVYKLYELTYEEVKIIDQGIALSKQEYEKLKL